MNNGNQSGDAPALQIKADFVKKIGQDIYAPVSDVITTADQLLGTLLNAAQKEAVQSIRYRSESVLTYLNDTIELAKMDAGEMRLSAVDFNLRDVIEETIGAFSEQAGAKGLEMASLFYQDVPRQLRGDAEKLQQILSYVVGNAIGYSEQGEMVVGVRRKSETEAGALLHFSVRDTGARVSKNEQQKFINNAFGDAKGDTQGFNPAGLRVAIVRKLAELMGGEVGVESVQGKGSTLWFTAQFEKQAGGSISRPVSGRAFAAPPSVPVNVPASVAVSMSAPEPPVVELPKFAAKEEVPSPVSAPTEPVEEAKDSKSVEISVAEEESMPEIPKFEEPAAFSSSTPAPSLPRVPLQPAKPASPFAVPQPESDAPPIMVVPRFRKESASDSISAQVFQNRPPADPIEDTLGGTDDAPSESDSAASESSMVPPIPKPPLLKLIMSKFPKPENGNANGGENGGSHKKRILVAEDNATNQRVILMKLQKMGYEAEVVSNGAEALDAVERSSYDLVLMDCMMPQMNGYDAALQIRVREGGNGRRIPIIAMAANAMENDREKCTASGMDDYISKTAGPEDLQRIIGNWLPA